MSLDELYIQMHEALIRRDLTTYENIMDRIDALPTSINTSSFSAPTASTSNNDSAATVAALSPTDSATASPDAAMMRELWKEIQEQRQKLADQEKQQLRQLQQLQQMQPQHLQQYYYNSYYSVQHAQQKKRPNPDCQKCHGTGTYKFYSECLAENGSDGELETCSCVD